MNIPENYAPFLLLLIAAHGMDLLSTWVGTPNLVLEGNPIARKLGWKWGIPVNLALCIVGAFAPVAAIAISTGSVLVAARNFQSAWVMRSLGEHRYHEWSVERLRETRITTFLFCLFAQTLLTASVGATIIYFSDQSLVLLGIGAGIVGYAIACSLYSLLNALRVRHAEDKKGSKIVVADKVAILSDPAD
jgi:hypothetical protein